MIIELNSGESEGYMEWKQNCYTKVWGENEHITIPPKFGDRSEIESNFM